MNLVSNPRFYGNLSDWGGSAQLARSLGYPLGACAKLEDTQTLTQAVAVTDDAVHTLHFFYRLEPDATLTAEYGAMSEQFSAQPRDVWHEAAIPFAPSTDATLTFTAAGGTCYVDAIALKESVLLITRKEVARRAEAMLSQLAIDAELSKAASEDGPEGDYSFAIDEALRALGAMDTNGEPDVTLVEAQSINALCQSVKTAMLQRLHARYIMRVDRTLGPHSESYSQIAAGIQKMLSDDGGSGGSIGGGLEDNRVQVGTLTRAGGWCR